MHKYLIALLEIAQKKGGQLLSTEYTGAHSKYKFIDEEGNEFEAAGYAIKNGRWSPYTAQKRKVQSLFKYTIQDLKDSAKKKGGDCLSTEFLGYKVKYLWVDSKGREFYKTYDEILNGQWSPFEKSEKLSKLKTKYSIEILKEYAQSKGGQCLSEEYTRLDNNYHWIDRNGVEFTRTWSQILKCNDVLFNIGGSKPEEELAEFVKSLGFNVIRNDRTILSGKELDIYLPELKIAIEMNGLLWHSEAKGKDKNYHLNKTRDCEAAGIQLIHIFENEWVERRNQVQSFLRSKFGKNSIYVYARKTIIQEVPSHDARDFLNKYHIQGSCRFNKSIGLYHNNELLCLLTVGLHHRNNKEWVLSRFVGKTNVTVVGGLSKLIKEAMKSYDSLSTWVDLRWSDGQSWVNLGWNKANILPPDYFYIDEQNTRKVLSKQSRKKASVNTPEGMTELQHAKIDGLTRVWDCGKLKLIYKNPNI